MFAKLLATVVGLGLTSGALLVNRQHRIDVAVEISRCGDRLRLQETSLALMQAEIAESVRPDRLTTLLAGLESPLASPEEAPADADPAWISIPSRFAPVPIAPPSEPVRVGS